MTDSKPTPQQVLAFEIQQLRARAIGAATCIVDDAQRIAERLLKHQTVHQDINAFQIQALTKDLATIQAKQDLIDYLDKEQAT